MTLDDTSDGQSSVTHRAVRLAVGLLQGALLSLLSLATLHHLSPFNRPGLASPLGYLLYALPTSFLLVWCRMRGRSIAFLLGIIGALTLAIAVHQVHQASSSVPLAFAMTVYRQLFKPLIFILLALALTAEQDRRAWPSYPRLFEVTWDLAVLLILGAVFVLLSWGVLWLMAGLFAIIGFHSLLQLLEKPWIWPLITCVAFAAAIAFCIEGDRLITGARRLMLALFSLLLPILGGLAAAFLLTLAFVPLSRLWTTHHAGLLLSLSAVLLILLLNAVYQDGRTPAAAMMRLSGRLAALEILPLTTLAVIALGLRVHDHGWSVERVVAAAGFSILTVYGIGYFVAALKPNGWLRLVEPVNVGAAGFTVLVIISLLTPIADPARIAVVSQVARLRSGSIAADRFDFAFLSGGSGRYGRDALATLVEHPPQNGAAAVRDRALAARMEGPRPTGAPTATDLAADITVHPAGTTLPEGLLAYATGPTHPGPWLSCLRLRGRHCDAVILPTMADGRQHVAIVQDGVQLVALFDGTATGWQSGGTLRIPPSCEAARTALLSGQATLGSVSRTALVLPSGRFDIEPPPGLATSCGN